MTNESLLIALDPSATGALSLAANASVKTSGVVFVDSSSSSALSAGGNAQLKAGSILVHGGVKKSGNASLSPTPITGVPALSVAALPLPSTAGMTNYGSLGLSGNSSKTIAPGIYSQIKVSGNAKLTLSSGIYIIEGGGFSVSSNASVSGSGVMILNGGSKYPSAGGTYGSIALSSTGTYNLSPATSGTYAGIVFFQPIDNTHTMIVNASAKGITGTIYAPAAQLSESASGALATNLIFDTLTINGNGMVTAANTPAVLGTSVGPTSPNSTTLTAAALEPDGPNTIRIKMNIKVKVTGAACNDVSLSSPPIVGITALSSSRNLAPRRAAQKSQAGNLFALGVTTAT